ncbi:hypothetical protein N7497_003171 [Penicillium chrysogenum]|nr:hypothetical protein N7497_003171 [Penicillium chrysogenum]
MTPNTKSVAFFGASTGVGLAALKHTLAAGHKCIALCREPSKLTGIFPSGSTPNLKVIKGNAHNISAVSQCIQTDDGRIIDVIVSTIGARPRGMTVDDPDVCKKGAATLLRSSSPASKHRGLLPLRSRCSYRYGAHLLLVCQCPRADKVVMEDRFAQSGEAFTILRASHLVDGESNKAIRVGIEDPKTGPESRAIGYTISREDAGRWLAENLVLKMDAKFLNKNVTVTY